MKEVAKLSGGERFTAKIINLLEKSSGVEIELSSSQKIRVQGYFSAINNILKTSELKRKPDNKVTFTWENVDIDGLADKVAILAVIGIDPMVKNHVNFIPHLNKHTGKYDMTIIKGYVGQEMIAKKFSLDNLVDIYCHLVYSNDKFIPLFKTPDTGFDSYTFEVPNVFDRGDFVGGFYYLEFEDKRNNKLRVFSKKDIEKRKPKHASSEFWGGKKAIWNGGKISGYEEVDGWFEEMVYKTLKRAGAESVILDPEKIMPGASEFLTADTEEVITEYATHEVVSIEDLKIEKAKVTINDEPKKEPINVDIQKVDNTSIFDQDL